MRVIGIDWRIESSNGEFAGSVVACYSVGALVRVRCILTPALTLWDTIAVPEWRRRRVIKSSQKVDCFRETGDM